MFLYPLVWRCIWWKLFDSGVPHIKAPGVGATLGYLGVGGMIGYAWLFEPWSANRSMNSMVDQYTAYEDYRRLGVMAYPIWFKITQN